MEIAPAAQVTAFAVFAFISVAGALGMTTTMSMFRSAIFLMASFIGVGGLFVIMMADLLGLLQVMMYIGGMLVMALFMVLFSGDPGGAMMASMMDLPLVEKIFSAGLKREQMEGDGHGGHDEEGEVGHEGHGNEGEDGHGGHGNEGEDGHGGHGQENGGSEHRGHGERNGGSQRRVHGRESGAPERGGADQHSDHDHGDGQEEHGEQQGHGGHEEQEGDHGEHEHEPMFIIQQKKPAAAMAVAVWLGLSALVVFRPAWPVVDEIPPQDSAAIIGDLLMNKYMIAFEGAGLMILLGIFGAVYLSRPGRFPDPTPRDRIQAAVAKHPAPIDEDPIEPENTFRTRQ